MAKSYRKVPWFYYAILGISFFLYFGPIFASSNNDEVCSRYDEENKDGCFCVKRPSSLAPGGYGRRITCHALKNKNTFPTNLPTSTIQLDLSNNGLAGNLFAESLSQIPYLQKLDLQGNDISFIENNAFMLTPHLEVLDMSRNRLKSIQSRTFSGLKKLEKLRLSDNQIQTVEEGSFDDLTKLEKLELSDNTLVCDCRLSWFIKWSETRSNLIANHSKLKCALPIKLADIHVRKIKTDDMKCDDDQEENLSIQAENNDPRRIEGLQPKRKNKQVKHQVAMLEMLPVNHQTVFTGDSLKLSCKAELDSSHKVRYFIK